MDSKTSQKHQANFLLSVQILQTLKAHVPARKQSAFVEEALQKALKKKQFHNVLSAVPGSWKTSDHPSSTEKFLRSLRESKRP